MTKQEREDSIKKTRRILLGSTILGASLGAAKGIKFSGLTKVHGGELRDAPIKTKVYNLVQKTRSSKNTLSTGSGVKVLKRTRGYHLKGGRSALAAHTILGAVKGSSLGLLAGVPAAIIANRP